MKTIRLFILFLWIVPLSLTAYQQEGRVVPNRVAITNTTSAAVTIDGTRYSQGETASISTAHQTGIVSFLWKTKVYHISYRTLKHYLPFTKSFDAKRYTLSEDENGHLKIQDEDQELPVPGYQEYGSDTQ